MASNNNYSLATTLAHAISFLTAPLTAVYPLPTVLALQCQLTAGLNALYAPTWIPSAPKASSGRRVLTLSPTSTPPRPIYAACRAASISWEEWIRALGGVEFDIFIDPGCVRIRIGRTLFGAKPEFVTVWSAEQEMQKEVQARKFEKQTKPVADLAQQLHAADLEDEEELFSMLADELRAPEWATPVAPSFRIPVMPSAPVEEHSRPASRLSMISTSSSSGFSSLSFSESDTDSVTSFSTNITNTTNSTNMSSMSIGSASAAPFVPRTASKRPRPTRVFINTTKIDSTPYDGGNTRVLTGGVMLGGPAPAAAPSPMNVSKPGMWRTVRY